MTGTQQQKRPVGRPSKFTQEVADTLCASLAAGQSLRTACKADDMPSVQTVFSWFRKYPEFLEQYARAKEEAADAFVEEMLDIADDGSNDWMQRNAEDGQSLGWKLNGEHVNRSRLRVDTRKWIASKLKPKRYGERIQTEHTGTIGIRHEEWLKSLE